MADAPQIPDSFDTYYLVLLKRGPEWTAERTPETDELLAGHFSNMNRLAEAGHLVVAGPFDDPNDEYAGLQLLRADSLADAEAFAMADPAVDAGRFTVEVLPWMVEEGTLDALSP